MFLGVPKQVSQNQLDISIYIFFERKAAALLKVILRTSTIFLIVYRVVFYKSL